MSTSSGSSAPRRRTTSIVIQALAAIFVVEIVFRQIPEEVGSHGWSPTAIAMVVVCTVIVVLLAGVNVRDLARSRR